MKTTADKRLLITATALFFGVWLLFLLWLFGTAQTTPQNQGPTRPRPIQMEQIYNFDVADKRLLVGYSRDVFVARVQKRVSNKPATTSIPGADGHPQTQYAARVSDVLKGRLTAGAEVTISQTGGKGLQSRKTYVVEGVAARGVTALDKPLKPGTEYLFCTVPDPANGWHTLSAQPWGDTPLFQNRDRVLDEFERAVRTQADPYAQGGPQ